MKFKNKEKISDRKAYQHDWERRKNTCKLEKIEKVKQILVISLVTKILDRVASHFGLLSVPHQGWPNLTLSNYISFIRKQKCIFEVRLQEPIRQISFKTHRIQQFLFIDPWIAVLMVLSLYHQCISSLPDTSIFKNVRNLTSYPSLAEICGLTVKLYHLLLSLKKEDKVKWSVSSKSRSKCS